MIVLITGPVRSGKSARAEYVARGLGGRLTYVATARVDPTDAEMTSRVTRHRAERGDLATIEIWQPANADLPAVVAAAEAGETLLVDSVGTWVAGHLLDLEAGVDEDPIATLAALEERTGGLIAHLRGSPANIVLVSEETGWGLVPPTALGRVFRDHLGRLGQALALCADRVELVVAGRALDLTALAVPIRS